MRQREAELRRTEEDVAMKQNLRQRQAVSQSDVLDAEQALAVAKSQLETAANSIQEAEARIEFLEVQRDDLNVTAPFAGAVIDRRVEPGEWVAAGTVVASLVTMDPIEAWLKVPARYLIGTESGTKHFRVRQSATGRVFVPVKIDRIPQVEPLSQLFTVVATLGNPGGILTPGESVTGIVPVGARRLYWRIPLNAVVQSRSGDRVFAVDPPAEPGGLPTARLVPVVVSFERDGNAFVDVESIALRESDPLVVEGNERLMPGQPLMIEQGGPSGGPGSP